MKYSDICLKKGRKEKLYLSMEMRESREKGSMY